MKKLNKIRLQNAVVLGSSEMKAIYGGSGGGDGSGAGECAWYKCTCSGALSGVLADSITRIIKGDNIITVTNDLAEGDCALYNSVSCEFDRYCS